MTVAGAAPRPLHLYVIRHARAEPRGARWPDDRRRPLTPAGIAAFSALARTARIRSVPFDLVLTSGLSRASQTARLLVAACRRRPELRVTRGLEPGHDASALLRTLRRRATVHHVALVGHEPDLSALLAWLTGRPVPSLRKGAICFVRMARIEPGAGRLAWTAVPRARAGAATPAGSASGRRATR